MSAPFVLVTGGKGGVGKTLLSANLGVQLAREGAKVLLVDLDLGLADLHVLLRLTPRRDVEDALEGRSSLAACLLEGPAGVQVLPAGSGNPAMAELGQERRTRLFGELEELSEGFDLVLCDSAAGIGADVLEAAARARLVLAVTTPEPAALTDAYGLVKALDRMASGQGSDLPTPELVINQVSGSAEAETTAARLAGVCRQFLARAPRLAGWLPRSPRVQESAVSQRPFVLAAPRSLETGCVRRLAQRVLAQVRPVPNLEIALKAGAGRVR